LGTQAVYREQQHELQRTMRPSTIMKIDAYSFGFMSIDGKGYSTDLIIYPDGEVRSGWWRIQGHKLVPDDLERMDEFKPNVIVIGTGANGRMTVPNDTVRYLRTICGELIIEDTDEAVRRFNALSGSGSIIGMFHLTC
jgi:hypothetical protein